MSNLSKIFDVIETSNNFFSKLGINIYYTSSDEYGTERNITTFVILGAVILFFM